MEKKYYLTAADRVVLESYKTLCDGLANYFGDGYEIVLHSLENLDSSVIKIINGYYTGRSEGAPITDFALQMLSEIQNDNNKDYIAYFSKNKKNEPMHSTTIAIKGVEGKIIGLLCINFYLNTPLATVINNISYISNGMERAENYAESSASLLTETITDVKMQVMNDIDIPTSEKNKEVIARLLERGVFELKDSVSRCANILGISKNTVYLHIRNSK